MDHEEPVVSVDEPQVKNLEDMIKRYLGSQKELMEMMTALFIRLGKLKDI